MPAIYMRLWDHQDREIIMPYSYGKGAKKPRKAAPVKVSAWQKTLDSWKDLFDMFRK